MSVGIYYCLSCDFSTSSYSITHGLGCPRCRVGCLSNKKRKHPVVSAPRRRSKNSNLDPTAVELYQHFNRQLLELRESEEIHFMKRRNAIFEENTVRQEAYKRRVEQSPFVFYTHRNSFTDQLHENEDLFNGINVERTDSLSIPDNHEDDDASNYDYWNDVPLSELVSPGMA